MKSEMPPQTPAETPPSYVGAVDGLYGETLSGWAVRDDGAPCEVTVRVGGARIGATMSTEPRGDLQAKGLSQGAGGWSLAIGRQARRDLMIEATLPDGSPLGGTPISIEAASAAAAPNYDGALNYLGAIDFSDGPVIVGWALSSHFEPAAVTIQVNDHPAQRVESWIDRPDLIDKQLTKSGGGWQHEIGEQLVDGDNRISVTFPDGSHLPGSPVQRWNGPDQPAPEPVAEPTATTPTMPSLAELDEVNLDDLSLAVAAGLIGVEAPVREREPEPVMVAKTAEPEPQRGFFGRLLGR